MSLAIKEMNTKLCWDFIFPPLEYTRSMKQKTSHAGDGEGRLLKICVEIPQNSGNEFTSRCSYTSTGTYT